MWFRNLRIWRLEAPWNMETDGLERALEGQRFGPCSPGQAETLGWEPPVGPGEEGEEDAALVREVSGCQLLHARHQERILPAAAIAEVLPERIAAVEAREGGPLRAARRRELAEEVRAELMPKALLKSTRQWMLVQRRHNLVLVDSATPARGEALLSLLRESLGNLPVRPLAFTRPLDGTLTAWLTSRELPPGFELGQWCDLEHPEDTTNKVRFRGQPLDEDEVTATLARGLRVTALELLWDAGGDEPLSCVLAEDGAIRRLRLPGADRAEGDHESQAARLDADLALLGLTLERFFTALFPALGGVDDGTGA